MRLGSFLFFFSFSTFIFSAPSKNVLLNAKRNLSHRNKKLSFIKKDLKNINKSLESLTDHYLRGMKLRETVSQKLRRARKEIKIINEKLEKIREENKRLALTSSSYLQLADKKKKDFLFLNMILKRTLIQNIKLSEDLRKNSIKLSKDLKMWEHRFQDKEDRQKQLDLKISQLEERKESLAHKYQTAKINRDDLYNKVKKFKFKKTKKKRKKKNLLASINTEFFAQLSSPIKSWKNHHFDRKGMTFLTSSKESIYAVNKGTVMYSGNLGAYGHLIIIKHDLDVHTLVLGEIQPTIKEGDVVNQNSKIGRISSSKKESKLYFEVRKNDQTITTDKWVKLASFTKRGESA